MASRRPLLPLVGVFALACVTAPETRPSAQDADPRVAAGQALYAHRCAECHGSTGEGFGGAPPLVGRTSLFLAERHDGFDPRKVAAWVQANMPADDPGTLSDDESGRIIDFLLDANRLDFSGNARVDH